jgi:16S rRNA (adenine1518-N6/adenine1519-N6)-dimethyltransferase
MAGQPDSDSLLKETKRRLNRLGRYARKSLGQHFLVDASALEKILAAAELSPEDTVIEVGPGLGVLTTALAKHAGRVVAVELDDALAANLKEEAAYPGNVSVVNRDILKTDIPSLLGNSKSYKLVANLPYYITAAVLRHFLSSQPRPQLMVLMLQKEVAESIAATDGNAGLLANSVRFYGYPHLVATVPAASFYPPPKVDSAVIKIEVYSRPAIDVSDEDAFFTLLKAAFSARRKQLPNALAQGLKVSKDDVAAWLKVATIEPQRRAESLSMEEWGRLWRWYEEYNAS